MASRPGLEAAWVKRQDGISQCFCSTEANNRDVWSSTVSPRSAQVCSIQEAFMVARSRAQRKKSNYQRFALPFRQ
jgi:hypothetical protein